MNVRQKLAYLAGLVDGEGSIGIAAGRNHTFVRLLVTGTDQSLAEWLVVNFGGNVQWRRRIVHGWKREFIWRLTHRRAVELIERLEPLLVVKWPQANLALAHATIRNLGDKVSLGYRKGWSYGEETKKALQFIRDAMKLFNARGAQTSDPWDFVEAAARG